jgi:hypothetical protein
MARYFKGYDKDSGRRAIEEFRRATGQQRGTPSIVSLPFDIREEGDDDISLRYYNPKEAPFLLDENGKQILDEKGQPLRDYKVAFDAVGPDNARPAALTVRPTSSTNFKRPYTVAAGWERYPQQSGAAADNLGTLTVLFRDGTLWNYYDVDRSFWIKFRSSISKGEYINKHAKPSPELTTNYRNGPADTSQVSEQTRQLIYTEARATQYRYATKRSYTYTNKATGERRKVGPGAVPKSAQRRRKKP